MILYNRLYVEPTQALMGQTIKKRLLILLNKRWKNTRGHNALFITITSKDSNQSFKKSENDNSKKQKTGPEGHLLALYIII